MTTADDFISALRVLEDDGDTEPLVELFGLESECGNLASPRRFRGRDGAREFWSQDRALFGEVRSEFRSVTETERRFVLEWTRTGTGPDGTLVEYEGVSVVDVGDDGITCFRAFYDPARLGRQVVA